MAIDGQLMICFMHCLPSKKCVPSGHWLIFWPITYALSINMSSHHLNYGGFAGPLDCHFQGLPLSLNCHFWSPLIFDFFHHTIFTSNILHLVNHFFYPVFHVSVWHSQYELAFCKVISEHLFVFLGFGLLQFWLINI